MNRNGAKVQAVIDNARFLVAWDGETQGGACRTIAAWPVEDQAGLLALLTARGTRLGGTTAQRVCRMVGRDTYILSGDVMKRLRAEGIVTGAATSRTAMAKVQTAFNQWRAESGRPLTQLSQILALSIE